MLASLHHKEGLVSQKTFEMQTMPEFGNPYFDDCLELLILNSRDCADDLSYCKCLLHWNYCNCTTPAILPGCHMDRTKSTIKKNSLPFKTPNCKKKSKISQQLTVQWFNASLFRHLYIANQQHEGDLMYNFSHIRFSYLNYLISVRFVLMKSLFFSASWIPLVTSWPSEYILSAEYLMVQLFFAHHFRKILC